MKFEEKIAGLCLFGYIRGVKSDERERCLRAIRAHYGPRIGRIVKKQIDKCG